MNQIPTSQNLLHALEAVQSWWSEMGVETVKLPPVKQTGVLKAKPKPQTPTPRAQRLAPPTPDIDKVQAQAKAATTLEALKAVIAGVDAGALSDHARNMVFARGNPDAKIMFIGEAPGREEDIKALPFVGQAGQLLDKMLHAIGLDETNAYITNVCNWRPPGNRNPSPEEIAICRPLIHRHIELVAPDLIVIVGGVALEALTGRTGIMKTRGQWLSMEIAGHDIPALPIYHPAFLLRRPELKKQAWLDLLTIQERWAQF